MYIQIPKFQIRLVSDGTKKLLEEKKDVAEGELALQRTWLPLSQFLFHLNCSLTVARRHLGGCGRRSIGNEVLFPVQLQKSCY